MILFFQIALLALVLLSSILVVGVPVIFASENNWTDRKDFVLFTITAWFFLVIVVGVLNSFVI